MGTLSCLCSFILCVAVAHAVDPSSIINGNENIPRVVSSSTSYGKTSLVRLKRPLDLEVGDLLVLFLSRSDGPLPLYLHDDGWDTRVSCFKDFNNQRKCATHDQCVNIKPDDYCLEFPRGRNGKDLATVAFTRRVRPDDLYRRDYFYNLNGSWPAWGILAVVRGAEDSINHIDATSTLESEAESPIRNSTGTSCDASRKSIFPSSFGAPGDLLLMHMAFDDTSFKSEFLPPTGSKLVNWVKGFDEAGFLFNETIGVHGETGSRTTNGPGGPPCKDVLLTLVIKGSWNGASEQRALQPSARNLVQRKESELASDLDVNVDAVQEVEILPSFTHLRGNLPLVP